MAISDHTRKRLWTHPDNRCAFPGCEQELLTPAFELHAIRHVWDSERQRLADTDLDVWTVGPRRRCL
jgi:hypothetical protein